MQSSEGKQFHEQNQVTSYQEKRLRYEELVRTTINELYSNPVYWEFFQTFREESVHDFIIEYASKKAWFLVNGDRLLAERDQEQFRYRDLAEKCIWEIQQKKLFNLQVEWRAGLTEIEGIRTTRDFQFWERAIAVCPFLEPVSVQDIRLYAEYLGSGAYLEKNWMLSWQDYNFFRNISSDSESIPAWYRFVDQKMGTGYLNILPDKKGAEEKRYLDAWCVHYFHENNQEYRDDEVWNRPLPDLTMNHETLDFFIRTFEPRQIQNFFEATSKTTGDSVRDRELKEALQILKHAPGNYQLPASSDWREGIIAGAKRYRDQKIATHLWLVYDEYQFRLQSGIAFNSEESQGEAEKMMTEATTYYERLLLGKAILQGNIFSRK